MNITTKNTHAQHNYEHTKARVKGCTFERSPCGLRRHAGNHSGQRDDASRYLALTSLIREDVAPRESGAVVVQRLAAGRTPGHLNGEKVDFGLIDERGAAHPMFIK